LDKEKEGGCDKQWKGVNSGSIEPYGKKKGKGLIKEGYKSRGVRRERLFSFMLKASGCAARITSPLVSILIRPEGRMLQLVEH